MVTVIMLFSLVRSSMKSMLRENQCWIKGEAISRLVLGCPSVAEEMREKYFKVDDVCNIGEILVDASGKGLKRAIQEAICIAAKQGHLDLVGQLLPFADVDCRDGTWKSTPAGSNWRCTPMK